MRRIVLSLIAAVVFGLVASPSFAADSTKMGSTKPKMGIATCPAGQTLVKGYTKKDGTKVAAYCRKNKAKPAMTSSSAPAKK